VVNTTDKDNPQDKPVHTADIPANKEHHNTAVVANNNFHGDQKTCSPIPVVRPSDKTESPEMLQLALKPTIKTNTISMREVSR